MPFDPYLEDMKHLEEQSNQESGLKFTKQTFEHPKIAQDVRRLLEHVSSLAQGMIWKRAVKVS